MGARSGNDGATSREKGGSRRFDRDRRRVRETLTFDRRDDVAVRRETNERVRD